MYSTRRPSTPLLCSAALCAHMWTICGVVRVNAAADVARSHPASASPAFFLTCQVFSRQPFHVTSGFSTPAFPCQPSHASLSEPPSPSAPFPLARHPHRISPCRRGTGRSGRGDFGMLGTWARSGAYGLPSLPTDHDPCLRITSGAYGLRSLPTDDPCLQIMNHAHEPRSMPAKPQSINDDRRSLHRRV